MQHFKIKNRRVSLLKQATHFDQDNNYYKYVNGSLWQYRENRLYGNLRYPYYRKVENPDGLYLIPITK